MASRPPQRPHPTQRCRPRDRGIPACAGMTRQDGGFGSGLDRRRRHCARRHPVAEPQVAASATGSPPTTAHHCGGPSVGRSEALTNQRFP